MTTGGCTHVPPLRTSLYIFMSQGERNRVSQAYPP